MGTDVTVLNSQIVPCSWVVVKTVSLYLACYCFLGCPEQPPVWGGAEAGVHRNHAHHQQQGIVCIDFV